MNVKISMNEDEIRQAIAEFILSHYNLGISKDNLHIEVKSKQNYKSEWEQAAIRLEAEAKATS
jgi:hypothetical protein